MKMPFELESGTQENITLRHMPCFWNYVGNRDGFMDLSPVDKEKVFLRWKWGSSDHNSNKDCENTRRGLLSMLTEKDYEKDCWKLTLSHEDKCKQYRQEMGI